MTLVNEGSQTSTSTIRTYHTIRYAIFTCPQKLTIWPASIV